MTKVMMGKYARNAEKSDEDETMQCRNAGTI